MSELKYEIFPEEMNQLRVEIDHHPDLLLILHEQTDKDVYMSLCEIAAYVGLRLEGTYTRDDILGIAKTCTAALYKKRSSIILPL